MVCVSSDEMQKALVFPSAGNSYNSAGFILMRMQTIGL